MRGSTALLKAHPHSADYVRQEAGEQNVLGADGKHDEQQPFKAHNVALGAHRERPASRIRETPHNNRKERVLDETVGVGAQAAFCNTVHFRMQPQDTMQRLLLLHHRLHVELQLVDHGLQVPAG